MYFLVRIYDLTGIYFIWKLLLKKYLGILEERRIIWIFEDFTFQIIINLNFCLIERKLKFRGYFQEMEEIY